MTVTKRVTFASEQNKQERNQQVRGPKTLGATHENVRGGDKKV